MGPNGVAKVDSQNPPNHPLKRKRGPSHSSGVAGDLITNRPAAKQSREEAVKEEVEEVKMETKGAGKCNTHDLSKNRGHADILPEAFGLLTDEQGKDLRTRLRQLGPEAFQRQVFELEGLSLRAVGTAFGIEPHLFFDDDELYQEVLQLALADAVKTRAKLAHVNTIDDAAGLLKDAKKILVITGAGISTSLGIPDFRSKKTGFYEKLKGMGIEDPEEVFDIDLFDEDPSTFYSLAADILPNGNQYTPTHAFIRLLQDKSTLLTNYTQNIDNLEGIAGIQANKLLQCHGSFATASCRICGHKVPGETIFPDIRAKRIALCQPCIYRLDANAAALRSRPQHQREPAHNFNTDPDEADASDDDIPVPGVMKPDITFFGEQLPDKFFSRFHGVDKAIADLVVVIGTSMQVAPVSKMPDKLAAAGRGNVPCIYVGREVCGHIEFDVQLLGECDTVVWELARRAGWDLKHEMVPNNMRAIVSAAEGFDGGYVWEVARQST